MKAITFSDEDEINTLILFLAYALGHLQLSDDDAQVLCRNAERLRQRIEELQS